MRTHERAVHRDVDRAGRRGALRAHRQGHRRRRATPPRRGSCRCRWASSSATCCPFTNVNGEFERLGAGQFRVTGAGADAWQGTDQYTTLYHPAGGDDDVRRGRPRRRAAPSPNSSGKAGLIIRNDMTQPGTSPGYAMLAWRPSGGMEFLTDPDGNGQLNASVAGGTTSVPKWLKLSRRGGEVSAYWSNNGTTWTQVGDRRDPGRTSAPRRTSACS